MNRLVLKTNGEDNVKKQVGLTKMKNITNNKDSCKQTSKESQHTDRLTRFSLQFHGVTVKTVLFIKALPQD